MANNTLDMYREKYKNVKAPAQTSSAQAPTAQKQGVLDKYREKYSDHYQQSAGLDIGSRLQQYSDNFRKFSTDSIEESKSTSFGTIRAQQESRAKAASDLRNEAKSLMTYLHANRRFMSEEDYDNAVNFVTLSGYDIDKTMESFNEALRYYSQWKSEDDYNEYTFMSKGENRLQRYQDNQDRIEELKKQKAAEKEPASGYLTGSSHPQTLPYAAALQAPEKKKEDPIDAEISRMETWNRNYERGNGDYSKVIDDYAGIAERDDFETVSAKRDYTNPTIEDLFDYDQSVFERDLALSNGGSFDGMGNVLDKDGNVVRLADEKKIEDRLGMYLSVSEDDKEEAYNRLSIHNGSGINTWMNLIQAGDEGSWNRLSEDEVNIYYYLLNNDGQETADKYLDDMKVELNRRQTEWEAQEQAKNFAEAGTLEKIMLNVATVPAQLLGGAASFVDDAVNLVQGKEINPYSAAHDLSNFSGTIRDAQAAELEEATNGAAIPFVNFTVGDLYRAGMSMADMGVGGMLGPTTYMALMGMGSASAEAKKLYEQGASREQIAWGGALAGAAEMVFESVSIGNLIDLKDAKTIGQMVKNALIQGGVEASEEGFTEIANTLTNALVMGDQSDWARLVEENNGDTFAAFMAKVSDVAKASLGGFISGMGSGGTHSVGEYAANQHQAAQTGQYIDEHLYGSDALMALAEEVAGYAPPKLQGRLEAQSGELHDAVYDGKGSRGKAAGKLYGTVRTAITQQNQADIAKGLQELEGPEGKRFTPRQARAIAEAAAASMNGEKLTERQQKTLDRFQSDSSVRDVVMEVAGGEQATRLDAFHAAIATDNAKTFRGGAQPASQGATQTAPRAAEQADAQMPGNVYGTEKTPSQGRYEVSDSGSAQLLHTGEPVSIRSVAEIRDGKMTLELKDGRKVSAEEISYASEDEALVYEAVAEMGVKAEVANVLLEDYRLAPNISGEAYAKGMRDAYQYGVKGYPASELANGTFTGQLTETQRMHAYGLGKSGAITGKTFAAANNAVTPKKNIRRMGRVKGIGITIAELNKAFNVPQQKAYKILSTISEVTGIDVVLYRSKIGPDGKLTAGIVDGIDMTGAQGAFSFRNDKIYIDVNAGLINGAEMSDVAKYSMLRTFSHEFIHFIEKHNAVEYENFRDLVFETMRKNGGDPDSLIEDRMRKDGNPDRERASREVVAEAMTDILPQSHFVENLAQKHRSLFEKLHDKLREFAKRIRDYFDSIGMNTSAEAAILKETVGDSVRYTEDIVKMFDRIAEQAVEHYQAQATAQKNTAIESGGVQYKIREIGDSGKFYVQADRQVLTGDDPDAWGRQMEKYINEVIRKDEDIAIPTQDGHVLLLTGRSAYKLKDRHIAAIQKKVEAFLTDEAYSLKGRAATHIDELIQVARFDKYQPDANKKHENDIGEDGFNYYEANFMDFDGTYYRIALSAGINSNEETAYSIGRIEQRRFPANRGSSSSKEALNSGRKPSGDIIYTSEDKSQAVKSAIELAYEKALKKKDGGNEESNAQHQARSSTLTSRDILANALETVAQNEDERRALQKYRANIQKTVALEEEVTKSRSELRDLRAKKGKTQAEKDRIIALQNAIAKAEADIKNYDSTLLKLEAAKPVKDMLARERTRAQRMIRENHKERASVTKQRAIVEKQVKDLTKMIANPTKDAHVPTVLHKPLQKLLDSIDFTSKRSAEGGEATVRDVAYTRALQSIRTAIAAQRTAMEGVEDGAFALDVPPEFLDKINKHIDTIHDATEGMDLTTNRVYDMSADELKDLAYLLGTINKAVHNIDKLHMEGAKARVSELAESTVREMGQRKPVKGEDGGGLMWANYTPTYAFERMGTAATQILDGLKQGQAKMARTVDGVLKFAAKTYDAKEVKAWQEKIHTVKLESGETVKLTTAQIMSFYCLSNRDQGVGHLTGGGIRVGTIGEGPGKTVQKQHFRLTVQDINQINGLLDKRQLDVANAMQKYMQDVGGRLGNEISMARWGFMQMTEENYFPIRSDSDVHDGKNPDQEKANLWALLNKSFTKSVTKGANDAVVVSSIFDVFADHMAEMAEYNAFALPLVDAMKWYNYRSTTRMDGSQIETVGVKKSLNDTLGTAAGKYFIDLMTDINSSQKGGRHEDIMGKLLSYSKGSAVGWNLRVAIQQPTAILRASLYLDMPDLARGSLRIGTKALVEEMQKYSGIAMWKSLGYYDLNVSRSVREQIKGNTSLVDTFNEWGMWLPGKVDEITWARIWAACKSKVSRTQNLKGEALLKETAKLFDDVVYHTQVVDSVLTKSSLMRSKSQIMKEFTSFMSEPTVSVNILMSAFQDYRQGKTNWEKAKRTFAICFKGYALSAMANALATSLMDAFRDDDEYEEFWEKYQQALLGEKFVDGNLVAELNPLEKLVFVKDALSLMRGYDVQNAYIKLVQGCIDLVDDFKRHLEGKGSITDYGIIYNALKVLGNFTGAAPANLARELVTIWNNTFGKLSGKKIHRYQTGVRDGIHNAFDAGTLTREEAIRELVLAQEAENEDEAYFQVKKWETGEDSKYSDLYGAAQKGESIDAAMEELTSHGMKEKDVLSNLKNKLHAWYTDPESEIQMSREETVSRLEKYTDLGSDEIQALVKKWDMELEAGFTYSELREQYVDGNISEKEAISYMQKYGGELKGDAEEKVLKWTCEKETGIAYDNLREEYVNNRVSKDKVVAYMQKYGGIYKANAEKTAREWTCEKETGIAYEDISSAYVTGKITASRAMDLRMLYGGYSREDARETVLEWQCEKDNGVKFDDIETAYKSGEISGSTAQKWLVKYGEQDPTDVAQKINAYDWQLAHPQYSLTVSQVISYTKQVEKLGYSIEYSGVDPEVFVKYLNLSGKCKGTDSNGDGKADSGSIKQEIMDVIDSLPITDEQKDALYLYNGWSKSKLWQAPWRQR